MPFRKGEVANPNGRPPKGRALTELLTKAGSKGKRNEKLAELVWAFATEGKVTVGGKTYKAEDIGDLLAAWKWIYQHIDGPAPTSVDVTSGGEKLPDGLTDEERRNRMKELAAAIAKEINEPE